MKFLSDVNINGVILCIRFAGLSDAFLTMSLTNPNVQYRMFFGLVLALLYVPLQT